MTGKVCVGVIGTSWFTDTFHLPGLASHAQAEVAAICGRDRARAEEVARKYAIPRVFTDYRALIEQSGVDAVVIAAPDDQHYPMAMAALEAGKHLLLEKPTALQAAQAREIYEKARSAGVIHLVMFTFRWAPEYQYLRELVEAGTVGRIYHAQVRYLSQWGLSGEYNWRYDRRRANGVLGDLGSHAFDLARLFMGDVARVSARLSAYIERPGADGGPLDAANDAAALLLEFASGTQATVQLSAVAHTSQLQTIDVELHGSDGSLSVTLPWQQGARVSAVRPGQPAEDMPVPDRLWCGVPPIANYMDRLIGLLQKAPIADRLFIDSILSGTLPEPNLLHGWKTQQVVDAALAADAKGMWVEMG